MGLDRDPKPWYSQVYGGYQGLGLSPDALSEALRCWLKVQGP
jgi:hypothetical protein